MAKKRIGSHKHGSRKNNSHGFRRMESTFNKFVSKSDTPHNRVLGCLFVFFLILSLFSSFNWGVLGAAVAEFQSKVIDSELMCPSQSYIPRLNDEGLIIGDTCCGDGVCEGSEGEDNCAYDCKQYISEAYSLDEAVDDLVKDIPEEGVSQVLSIIGGADDREFIISIKRPSGESVKYKITLDDEGKIGSVKRMEE